MERSSNYGQTESGEPAAHVSEVKFSSKPADPSDAPSNARFDPSTGENVTPHRDA